MPSHLMVLRLSEVLGIEPWQLTGSMMQDRVNTMAALIFNNKILHNDELLTIEQ
ncbi:hypothetical protein [Lysinibacillus capsici]|uniref:hypothetical protein n=1 Tax=Lysinibacillus capsici TaxID=2115968 RepID=UPI00308193DA|nr:hypothetical protein ICJ70_07495 [Lysinibacillus capsici]